MIIDPSGIRILDDTDKESRPKNLIRSTFPDPVLKWLFQLALRVDIADNNDKADMIRVMFASKEFKDLGVNNFTELGTGTNRIAFLHNGLVYKIALDRRGFVDCYTEFKRSIELPMYLVNTYETNMLINVCEYVTLIDQDEFADNEEVVKAILEDISNDYVFNDLGYSNKNYCNWGHRPNPDGTADLVILDYGYLYPLTGQNQDELFRCPKCGDRLHWNNNYTAFLCTSSRGGAGRCGVTISPTDIQRRMNTKFEEQENAMLNSLYDVQMPNQRNLEQLIKYSKKESEKL